MKPKELAQQYYNHRVGPEKLIAVKLSSEAEGTVWVIIPEGHEINDDTVLSFSYNSAYSAWKDVRNKIVEPNHWWSQRKFSDFYTI